MKNKPEVLVPPRVERWESFENKCGEQVRFPIFPICSYAEGGVPVRNCAGYARRVAQMVFGMDYLPRSAWDFRYVHAAAAATKFRTLKEAYQKGMIRPGCLVGFYNPNSTLAAFQEDQTGKLALYTHVAVFMGQDSEDYLRFGQQIVDERVVSTDREMHQRLFEPREVIFPVRRR